MPYCARGLYFKRWHLAKCNVPQRTGRGYTLETDATAAERRMIMARLIDADKLIDFIDVGHLRHSGELCYSETEVANLLLHAPTVDAVEVVRCRDCKHYKPQKKSAHWENRTNYCNRIVTIKVQPYDFCSYGERKEGAD